MQIQLVIAHVAIEIFDPMKYPNPEKKGMFLPFGPLSEIWNVHENLSILGLDQLYYLLNFLYYKRPFDTIFL